MLATRRTRIIAATVVLAAATALAGCSPFAGGGDDADITLLTLDGGDDNATLEEMVTAYEEQSGLTVSVTYVPEDTYVTKLQTALIADAPDIASTYNFDSLPQFIPLDEIVYAEAGLSVSDFNSSLPSLCDVDGTIRCVGTTLGNMVLFYNKAIFDAAGVAYPDPSVPLTFDEFSSLAAQLAVPAADDASTVFGAGSDTLLAYLDPADVLDDTGRVVEATNPNLVGTVEILAGMVADGTMPSIAQSDALGGGDGAPAMFLDGKVGMLITDNFLIDSAEVAGLDYGLAPTPVVAGSEPWIVTWTNSFGIPAKSDNKEQAADFLAFMATEGQVIQAKYGFMPLANAVAETWATTEQRQQLVEVSKLVRPSVFNPNQWAWNAPIIDAINAALDGGDTTSLLEEAEPKAQQGLDTTWEIYEQALEASGK